MPYVGIYTAFTKGNFFLDGQVRVDYYTNSLSDSANGLFGQRLDARGVSLTGNVGYNIPLHSGWFVEPSAGLVWSRVEVDPLNVAGVLQTAAPFAPYARGIVTVEDIESLLGRLSFTVGTNFTSHGVAWQPYFTASVYNEFAGNVHATSVVANTGNAVHRRPPAQHVDRAGGHLRPVRARHRGGDHQYGLARLCQGRLQGWRGYRRLERQRRPALPVHARPTARQHQGCAADRLARVQLDRRLRGRIRRHDLGR